MIPELILRRLDSGDSMADLTALLHRAYHSLAAAGQRFLASHQDEDTTRRRCSEGECWVAVQGRDVVATLTWRSGGRSIKCPWYDRQDVAIFGQFAVAPEYQGRGIGSRLLDLAESRARVQGFAEIACDTSENAEALLSYYGRRGYRVVESVQWEETNYRSAVLSKPLPRTGTSPELSQEG
jgi:ribosomal protein S18 acetylase RimI-like enzyme